MGLNKSTFFVAAALALAVIVPALAQRAPGTGQNTAGVTAPKSNEAQEVIVVTARRRAEKLQKVPISITVFNQAQLNNRNVTETSDLATYTPDLSVNERFGAETATFAIRGFTQELRTEPSVAVYFADVTAPHGGNAVTAGDGDGPGSFFDLQNVQILKGPQGTLFGRNTTGGAVLLVPQKPTAEYGGYIETSYGNYDMKRLQGVVNIPFSDTLRFRAGFDTLSRDGYLINTSGIGPSHFDNRAYFAGRASLVWDATPDIENYTIVSGTRSQDYGSIPQMSSCNPAPTGEAALFAVMCKNQIKMQGTDPYDVQNTLPSPINLMTQWQVINTTTWNATDNLTVKNIASYAQLETLLRLDNFGSNWHIPASLTVGGATIPLPASLVGQPLAYSVVDQPAGIPLTDQSTYTEELQFLGKLADDRLTWQAGGYFEKSEPLGTTGQSGGYLITCPNEAVMRCFDTIGQLAGTYEGEYENGTNNITYENDGIYAQGTYALTDQLKATGGVRYTWSSSDGSTDYVDYLFPHPATAPSPPIFALCGNEIITTSDVNADIARGIHNIAQNCNRSYSQFGTAPTWLADLEYTPIDSELLYAKYARGYRQGNVNLAGPPGYTSFGPEHVNSYEVGSKTTITGAVSGIFDVTAFYNDFTGQQLQYGAYVNPASAYLGGGPTTAIVNAGTSRIWGLEAETSLLLFQGFRLDASYAYLNTLLESIKPAVFAPPYLGVPTSVVGGLLTFSPKNKIALTPSYTLPIDPGHGKLAVSATYVLQSSQTVSTGSPYGLIGGYGLLNLNLNWSSMQNLPLDLSLFATNVLDKKYRVFVPGTYDALGFEPQQLGEPLIFGVRLRYRFGQ